MKTIISFISIMCIIVISSSAPAAIQGDVDNDGHIDTTEAIYALQVAAGFYPDVSSSCLLNGVGTWAAASTYTECDVVEHAGTHYICSTTHTASGTFDSDIAYWTLLALKGETGEPGPQGDVGEKGAQGSPGPKGETGATGPEGPAGPEGDNGSIGPQGPAGPIGGSSGQLVYNNNGSAAGTSITYNNSTTSLNMQSATIVNLGQPVAPSDAATKSYVDTALANVSITKKVQRGEWTSPSLPNTGSHDVNISSVDRDKTVLFVSCAFSGTTGKNCSTSITFVDSDTVRIYYSSDYAAPKIIHWQAVEYN